MNSYFVGINPHVKKELFELCVVCKNILSGIEQSLRTARKEYDLHQTDHVVLFLSTFYNVRTIFHTRIELNNSTIFCPQMNKQNRTPQQLNYKILPMHMLQSALSEKYWGSEENPSICYI